ncbi:MAG: hypothetical protein ABL921_28515, partial [Pirellula sp.]
FMSMTTMRLLRNCSGCCSAGSAVKRAISSSNFVIAVVGEVVDSLVLADSLVDLAAVEAFPVEGVAKAAVEGTSIAAAAETKEVEETSIAVEIKAVEGTSTAVVEIKAVAIEVVNAYQAPAFDDFQVIHSMVLLSRPISALT